jgi:DNA-binding transcriptional regulator YhcF (GntR family)
MNSHEFRVAIKNIDATSIKEQKINPAHFKAVAFALSMYGDYEKGTRIRPSWKTVAKDACVDRKTAFKVRDYLIQLGLIVEIRTTSANITEYAYCEKSIVEEEKSIIDDQKSILDTSEVHLGGPNRTIYRTSNRIIDTTINNKPGNKSKWQHTDLSILPGSLLPVSGISYKGDGNE